MRPASQPRSPRNLRILVVDAASGSMHVASSLDLASLFEPGDLLVVNDAATLPASLRGLTEKNDEDVELRLVTMTGDLTWTVALLGAGDYRTRTEDRPLPPTLSIGDHIAIGDELIASVVEIRATRLIDVAFRSRTKGDDVDAIWAAIYRMGKPVQYTHVPSPLALWDIQNVYAGRPWAVEMPSAGRSIRIETLLDLQKRGVEIARVTHAAGISSIGDPAIDAQLPFPERFEVREETWDAIARTRKRGGRVVAIGTSAARALEGAARRGTKSGVTDLKIGPTTRRAIVDAVLTGVHDTDTSHYTLLHAFAKGDVLARALAKADAEGLLGHELGDACLVWGEPRDKVRSVRGEDVRSDFSDPGPQGPNSRRTHSSHSSPPSRSLWTLAGA